MKKSLTITLCALIISIILSAVVTKAAGNITFVGIELKSFSKLTVIDKVYTKTQDYVQQEYESSGTVNNYGGGEVAVKVQTIKADGSGQSGFLTLYKFEKKAWAANSTNYNHIVGDYKIAMKTADSTVFGANHSGIWFYN